MHAMPEKGCGVGLPDCSQNCMCVSACTSFRLRGVREEMDVTHLVALLAVPFHPQTSLTFLSWVIKSKTSLLAHDLKDTALLSQDTQSALSQVMYMGGGAWLCWAVGVYPVLVHGARTSVAPGSPGPRLCLGPHESRHALGSPFGDCLTDHWGGSFGLLHVLRWAWAEMPTLVSAPGS